MNKNIACILTDGFEELEMIATVDILRRSGVNVHLYSLNDRVVLNSAHQISITNLYDFSKFDPNNYDGLFIAGGPQYLELSQNVNFLKTVKQFSTNDKYIGAICAAPTILGHLGLLKGKKYTCFSSMNENFGGEYLDEYFVRDGNLLTGKGPLASIEFALQFVEMLCGKEKAEEIKKGSYYYCSK